MEIHWPCRDAKQSFCRSPSPDRESFALDNSALPNHEHRARHARHVTAQSQIRMSLLQTSTSRSREKTESESESPGNTIPIVTFHRDLRPTHSSAPRRARPGHCTRGARTWSFLRQGRIRTDPDRDNLRNLRIRHRIVPTLRSENPRQNAAPPGDLSQQWGFEVWKITFFGA
jgi:hypothetical protein